MAYGSTKCVFISYVREDSERVDDLCRVLESAGIPFWRDRTSLAPGDAWKQKIREAIRSDTLVCFLACFSTSSVARDKSYMNEELTLAAEEFRLRPPGRPWLLPVRFDDVTIPYWDLGAGRSIEDYNLTDLFDDHYGPHLVALVQQIKSLSGDPDRGAAVTVAEIAQSSSADRAERLRKLTKELLLDRSRRIELDDVINDETRRVRDELADTARFPVYTGAGGIDELLFEVVAQAQRVWEMVEPLCWSVQVAARYADADALAPWISALRNLAVFGEKPATGLPALLHLRRLPALCLAETAALSCVSNNRWDNLCALLATPCISIPGEMVTVPLIFVITQYGPFEVHDMASQILLAVTRDPELDGRNLLKELTQRHRGRIFTPVSSWIYEVLKPVFDQQFPDDEEYADEFDRAECFLGAIEQYERVAHAAGNTYKARPASWYGRSTWRSRGGKSPVDAMLEEARKQGEDWEPFRAKLFGDDFGRTLAAIEKYREYYNGVRQQQR